MDAPAPSSPIVQFTLRVLESLEIGRLAEVCATESVACLGACAARVVADGIELAAAGDPGAEGAVAMRFKLPSGPDGPSLLELWMRVDDDLPIVRQQVLDLVAVVRRVWTQAMRLAEEKRSAREDKLTGLGNRRAAEELLEGEVASARRAGRPLSVMVVDLDHFKTLNDTEGHLAGDEVLRAAGDCFRRQLPARHRVNRLGGDEFMVVLDGVGAVDAVPLAERLRSAFAADPRARGVTMTIGIADTHSVREEDAAALLERADRCLYAAKRLGKNRTSLAVAVPGAP